MQVGAVAVIVAALVAATAALVGVIVTVAQKNRTDSRAAWWARVERALNALNGSEEERRIGIALLGRLAFEKRVDRRDRDLIETTIVAVLGH